MMKFFENKKLGINIDDNSIELVELSFVSGHGIVSNSNKIKLEKKIIELGLIKNKKKLKEIFEKLFKSGENGKFSKSEIVFSVQEGNVYSHLLFLNLQNKDFEKVIFKKIAKMLPKNISKYSIEYRPIYNLENIEANLKNESFVYVNAVEREYLDAWNSFFKELGLNVAYFIPKSIALNSLISENDKNILILDINCENASLSVFLNSQIIYSYKIKLEEELSIEELSKININKNGEESAMLRGVLLPLIKELEISINFIFEKTGRRIKEIYFAGDLSELNGIFKFFKDELDEKTLNIFFLKDLFSEKKLKTKLYTAFSLAKSMKNNEEIFFQNKKFIFNNINYKLLEILSIKKIIFKGVFLALLFSFLAFLYYSSVSHNQNNVMTAKIDIPKYSSVDNFSYKVFLATDEIHRDNEIRGREYKIFFKDPLNTTDILKISNEKLLLEIKEGEFFWETPINNILNKESLIFPMELTWFIGQKNDLDSIILAKVSDKLNKINDYEILVKKDALLEKSIFKTLYISNIKVSIKHNNDIDVSGLEEEVNKRIIIVNSKGRSINVRKGPGLDFPVIAKAFEGETYQFLRNLNFWSNVVLSNGDLAWVSSRFIKEIK